MKSVTPVAPGSAGTPVSEIVTSVRYAESTQPRSSADRKTKVPEDEQHDDGRERVHEAPDAEAVHARYRRGVDDAGRSAG